MLGAPRLPQVVTARAQNTSKIHISISFFLFFLAPREFLSLLLNLQFILCPHTTRARATARVPVRCTGHPATPRAGPPGHRAARARSPEVLSPGTPQLVSGHRIAISATSPNLRPFYSKYCTKKMKCGGARTVDSSLRSVHPAAAGALFRISEPRLGWLPRCLARLVVVVVRVPLLGVKPLPSRRKRGFGGRWRWRGD